MSAGTQQRPLRRTPLSRIRTAPPVAALAAGILAPVLLWIAVVTLAGHDLAVRDPGRPDIVIGLPAVIAVSTLASAAGWLAQVLLAQLTRRGRPLWATLATVVLVLSFVPVAAADMTPLTRVTLVLMHLAVAAGLFTAAFSHVRAHRAEPADSSPTS